MKVGMIGLGKLGLPVAVAMDLRGHDVMGYDLDPARMSKEPQPYQETGPDGTGDFNEWLARSNVKFGTMQEVADHADLIFVAVQTPHEPRYEGISPLPKQRVDFDYSHLVRAVRDLMTCVTRPTVVAVISTCLPGTMRREVVPLMGEHGRLLYNPYFIAMGTTMRDFLNPEFVLLGSDDNGAFASVMAFYGEMYEDGEVPMQVMSIESAELTKVAYNTFISLKVAWANTVMEICTKFPRADCDEVSGAIEQATDRVVSPRYMRGGMGDGGGCHPRDNIAMSYLAQRYGLSYDLFEAAMRCRENQARWKAEILVNTARENNLPVIIYGYAFKPGTNLTVGSPAKLVANWVLFLKSDADLELMDPHVNPRDAELDLPAAVYLIGCRHPDFADQRFPAGSIVIDPHRIVPDHDGVTVWRVGEGRDATRAEDMG